jgi:hypothetical protein
MDRFLGIPMMVARHLGVDTLMENYGTFVFTRYDLS